MKNIYNFDKIEVLKADGCTEKQARYYLSKGTTIYSPEDYLSMLHDFPDIAREIEIFHIDQVLDRCKNRDTIGDTNFLEYKNVPCVIEYVL